MSSASKNHVKFRKDATSGGSRPSHGHRRSDSGVGSLSDQGSHSPSPDRSYTPIGQHTEQRLDLSTLQEALAATVESRDKWKAKAQELDADLSSIRKELKEVEARWNGLFNTNEVLEGDKKKILGDKRALVEENSQLKEKLEKAERKIKRHSNAGPPPAMSGAMPATDLPESSKIRRSSSTRKRDKAAEEAAAAEQAKKDKARWSKRFDRTSGGSDESDKAAESSSSTKPHRVRRTSYIEPMGPPAVRPMAAPMPPSPSRHYTHYTTTAMYPPQYATSVEPVTSSLPRSYYEDPPYLEDGNYHARAPPPPRREHKRGS